MQFAVATTVHAEAPTWRLSVGCWRQRWLGQGREHTVTVSGPEKVILMGKVIGGGNSNPKENAVEMH